MSLNATLLLHQPFFYTGEPVMRLALVGITIASIALAAACKQRGYNGDNASETASLCSELNLCSNQKPLFCVKNSTSKEVTVQVARHDIKVPANSQVKLQTRGSDPANIPLVTVSMDSKQQITGATPVTTETEFKPRFTDGSCFFSTVFDTNILEIGLDGETLVFKQP
jgi:hypothetical protein